MIVRIESMADRTFFSTTVLGAELFFKFNNPISHTPINKIIDLLDSVP